MSRPKKATAEYFPHFANSGKTLFILENHFGNDGYAAWFKILEILCLTENHFYDCRNPEEWEFLLAKTRLCGEKLTEILNMLAKLKAINPELWAGKIIRSDNLIENLAGLYNRRQVDVISNDTLIGLLHTETPNCGVNVNKNPQSKGKESKGKESKEEETITENDTGNKLPVSPTPPAPTLPESPKKESKRKVPALVDEDFLASLEKNPAYKGIDIRKEHGKMMAWIDTPRGSGKLPTRQRFLNWLNRCNPQDSKAFTRYGRQSAAETNRQLIDDINSGKVALDTPLFSEPTTIDPSGAIEVDFFGKKGD